MQNNERSVRSVFVGNIPYDATEEKLKDIFSEVGPVVSFRLVYDRDTGKPKGYGFCEYRDQETAMSAMRNLNGFELNGRTLRVDNAANENAKEQMRNLQQQSTGPGTPTPFETSSSLPSAPEGETDNAPEAIGKAVASLPPEQMFELAKQMKQCIVTNPNEARNMLIQNPQLCYGLLHALVAMRVVDSNVAVKMLHRPQPAMKPLIDSTIAPPSITSSVSMNPSAAATPMAANSATGIGQPTSWNPAAGTDQFGRIVQPPMQLSMQPSAAAVPAVQPGLNAQPSAASYDPRMYGRNPPPANVDPRIRPNTQAPFDPRLAQQNNRNAGPSANFAASLAAASPGMSNPDQLKADLIMQVLQLSDEQISRFTPEQQQSIMLIKQQMSNST